MNTSKVFRKTTLTAVVGGFAFATVFLSQPHSASAVGSRPIDLKASSLYGLGNLETAPARPAGTFTLTFNGQTTTHGKGGNVEYEWKVEEAGFSLGSPTLFSGDTRVEGDEHEIEYDLVAAK